MTEENRIKKIEEKKREKIHFDMIEKQLLNRRLVKTAPEDVCISFRNINKIYPNHKQAVFDFNLDIKEKEFIVFVGPSGCGKSTTLRMLAGLEDITYGDLFISGKYANDLMPKERDVAMVFQNYALYPNMTVYDNMAFSLQARKFDKKEIDIRVRNAAKILEIEEYLDVKPANLSGGQRQRVALGRAIVRNAKVFLMDEPLSNLDAKLRVQMRSEIVKLHNRVGATTVYVTHDQTEAMTMATRIVVMKGGFVQQIGTPKDIYNNPSNVFVAKFIGSPAMNVLSCKSENGCVILDNGLTIELSEERRELFDEFYRNAIQETEEKIVSLEKEIEARKYELTHPDYVKRVLVYERSRNAMSSKVAKLAEKLKKAGKKSSDSEDIALLEAQLKKASEDYAQFIESEEKAIRSVEYKEVIPKNYDKLLLSDDYLTLYRKELDKLNNSLEHYKAVKAGDDKSFLIGIRPEEICPDNGGTYLSREFKAQVTVAELLGHEYYVHFNIGSSDVTAKLNSDLTIEAGDEISLKLDLRYMHLFDAYSEKRIF